MGHLSTHLLSKDIPDDSPPWEKYAWKMRAARLNSLKLDPESFMSKYDSEVKQPIDFTIGRLREPNAWTIILVRTPDEAASPNPDLLLREDTEYVGFCVMIDTHSMPASMTERDGTSYTDRGAEWFMAAVYVDRSVRGAGAGKRMVQFGLDTIRDLSSKTGRANAVCVTGVRHGNNNALELYKKLGFEVTNEDDVEEKEGKSYQMTELKMRL